MNIKSLLYPSLALMLPLLANAGTVTIVQGSAGDSTFVPATAPSPSFPNVINFSSLASQITDPTCDFDGTPCPTFVPTTYSAQGVTISSPNGLEIAPYSSQTSSGIELLDEGVSGDGTADITVSLAGGVEDLAVGIQDSDSPVNVVIDALDQNGNILDSLNVSADVLAADSANNLFNTYFVAEDTTDGIYGVKILQTTPNAGFGLALAEVEYSPEPSTLLLLIGGGLAVIGSTRLRKKA